MIALIDYGAGNLTSVRKALAAAGAELLEVADERRVRPDRVGRVAGAREHTLVRVAQPATQLHAAQIEAAEFLRDEQRRAPDRASVER